MKRSNHLLLMVVTIMLCTTLTGCSKLLDYVNEQDGGHHLSRYRVKTIMGWAEYDTVRATFTYNQWGDPVKIWLDNPGTGRPHTHFTYDKKRRLIDFVSHYGDLRYFERWVRYYYNEQGVAIRDTSWYQGEADAAGPIRFGAQIVSVYSYDSYGRMIKSSSRVIYPPNNYVYEDVFMYDSNGNREWLGYPALNDTKVNFLRTHPVWQLGERDYSLNNPFVADAYNEARLPVSFHIPGDFMNFRFLQVHFPANRIQITYEKK